MNTKQMIKPEALYDSLYISHKLSSFLDAFKINEIHLFSYFASILSLYDGKTPDFWNYRYIPTEGYPFSNELNLVIINHIRNGWFEEMAENYYKLSAKGLDTLNEIINQKFFKPRENYLNAACTTSILIPYRETIEALTKDPAISNATTTESKLWLDSDLSSSKFKELSNKMGISVNDLTITSLGWIQYLLLEKDN